jgi:hypothetical protein
MAAKRFYKADEARKMILEDSCESDDSNDVEPDSDSSDDDFIPVVDTHKVKNGNGSDSSTNGNDDSDSAGEEQQGSSLASGSRGRGRGRGRGEGKMGGTAKGLEIAGQEDIHSLRQVQQSCLQEACQDPLCGMFRTLR